MSVAASNSSADAQSSGFWGRFRLAESKGQELVGLLMLTLGLLLGISLLSYHPADPSAWHQAAEPARVHNWIGPVGAHVSDLLFGLFGLSSLLVPGLLLLSGWRRFRSSVKEAVVGRGFGGLILLATLPGLLQLLLGEFSWRGGTLDAGGGFGALVQRALETQLHFVGALLILLAGALTGVTLMIQSSLGDLLERLRAQLVRLGGAISLRWARRRERLDRESRSKQRAESIRRVMEKHGRINPEHEEAAAIQLPPPRVRERKGEKGQLLRRVRVEDVAEEAPATSPPPTEEPKKRLVRPAAVPQQDIAFTESVGPGELPPVNLLQLTNDSNKLDESELLRLGEMIRSRCAEFGVEGSVVSINPGPVITVFEFQPAPGVKVSQIVNLQDDLALALKADSVRIDRIAGRSTLGIEVPNAKRSMIHLGSLLVADSFQQAKSPLTLALG
ncbi:MAG: DNA translocase FtsK 4TM domain-containing protein, partial [Acidobacteria bacterium]|nr:DNA translocase FtsK 4TM domain-containing protein [Acidobacteriota bacterium]